MVQLFYSTDACIEERTNESDEASEQRKKREEEEEENDKRTRENGKVVGGKMLVCLFVFIDRSSMIVLSSSLRSHSLSLVFDQTNIDQTRRRG